ncbi:MAG: thioredoxin domain-containing protein [Nannocystaceae bacterium]
MHRLLVPLTSLVLLFGCDNRGSAPADDAKSKSSPGGAAVAADDSACATFADSVCGHSGPEKPVCEAAKTSAKILPAEACALANADLPAVFAKIDEIPDPCKALLDRLCGELGEDTQTCKMVRTQGASFPPAQCEQMTQQYDQVIGQLKAMEAKNKPLDQGARDKLVAGDPPGFGPANATVTVVEFSDFQCPYCSQAAKTVHKLQEEYKDKVRFVFRQYPLPFHGDAHLAAQASLAAHAEGKFWLFHDAMFENQKALKREDLEGYAKAAGVDMGKFKSALDGETYKAAVDADLELGKEVFVDGTPTLFVNGKRAANPSDFDAVKEMIESELSGGTPG